MCSSDLAETQAEGEAGSMHWEPDVGFDPGSPGSRPGPKAGAKPLRHPGIPATKNTLSSKALIQNGRRDKELPRQEGTERICDLQTSSARNFKGYS